MVGPAVGTILPILTDDSLSRFWSLTLQTLFFSQCSAEHQSQLLEKLKKDFVLTEKELQVLMRGRNSVTRSKNRRDPAAYQDSTSFEALIGYLYISDKERCTDLLNWLDVNVDVGL